MAQNHNGSEPLLVCGGKGQKAMWCMELWKNAIGFGEEKLVGRVIFIVNLSC